MYAMGKTLPPFSQLIEYEGVDCAKLHIQSGVMVARPWPFETIVMAMLLEQQKQVERLERLLDELQARDHP
jgi:hypothetical protein